MALSRLVTVLSATLDVPRRRIGALLLPLAATKKRATGVFLTAVLASMAFSANVYAATMDDLLKGHDLRLEYAAGAFVLVSFYPNGRYKTNTGSSGSWTLTGVKLCTVRSDGVSGCGRLPRRKSPGDVWASTDANGVEVIASIVPRQ